MIDIQIDAAVFNAAYLPYLNDATRTQIFYGGSGSGKSVFLAQRVVYDLLRGGRNYLICRKVGRDSRYSTFVEVTKIINEWGVAHLFDINLTLLTVTCSTNGYQAIFKGLDDLEKVKSITPARGVITDIWVEEATQASQDDIKQLTKRQRGGDASVPKRLTLSFNPILRLHWIYQTYFNPIGWSDDRQHYKSNDLTILKTWYIHNRFLTPADIDDLLNEQDDYYRSVYTLGNWGVLGDVVFTNWRVEDLSDQHNQFTNRRFGLDFGFSSDPAAMVATHYDKTRKAIYIYRELYERGLTNDILATEVQDVAGSELVTCDSAEPKSIAELTRYGIKAQGAKKGKDSVLYGIQWLQQQTIVIDKSCVNAINEFQLYQWKKDKYGGSLRQPIDRDNHIIDALRYAYEQDMTENVLERDTNPFYN